MSWRQLRLGDAFTIKHGYAFKSQFFCDEGRYIVLTPGNFNEAGGFRARPGKDRFYSTEPPDEFVLKPDDLIIAMTEQGEGLLGSSALVPHDGAYLHNQRIGLLENLDQSKLEKRFLFRLFNSRGVRSEIRATASGTKVRHTAPKRIYSIFVDVPSVGEQRRVADILDAYDDLIENNRRRIALLEEAARLLYREWFIHFRFPGHEHAQFIDGLPEGWQRRTLGDIADVRKGKNITKETATPGEIPVVAGGLQPAYFHAEANAHGPVITVSASGANAGYVNLYLMDIWASDCSYIESGTEVWFLYLSLKERQREITGMQKGAAQPHVYPKDLARLQLILPSDKLRTLFSESVETSFRQIENLSMQNQKLAQARDLLLPRLMSGELAV